MGFSPRIYLILFGILLIIGGMYVYSVRESEGHVQPTILYPDSLQPLDLNRSPGEISDHIRILINETRQNLDQITFIQDKNRTTGNTLLRFEDIMTSFDDQTLLLGLISDEYQDPGIIFEARDAMGMKDAFLNEAYLRPDLAHALSMVSPDGEEEQNLKEKILGRFDLALLPEERKTNLTMLGENLSALEKQYAKNQQSGYASSNLDLMNRIVAYRQEIVSLLGYRSFSDYQIARSGIPSDSEKLTETLYLLSAPIIRLSHEEESVLLKMKQMNDPDAAVVYDYEIVPLRSGLPGASARFNPEEVSEYFPSGPVIVRMNQVFSRIFGITISPVGKTPGLSPDFNLYRITDPESGVVRGWFYLGIRRDENGWGSSGKTIYLRAGHDENGTRVAAVSAIILTIPQNPSADTIMFSPVDMQNLFHEYGHMLRHSLAKSRYATLSSGAYERTGYNEIPSHFLERFLWTPEVLDQISGTIDGRKIPEKIRDQVISDHGQEGLWGLGYIRVYDLLLSLLDLSLNNGGGAPDFPGLYSSLYQNLTGYQSSSGGADLLLNPAFFLSANAGTYWHYVLDDAYAAALFERFKSEGVLNESTGVAFRKLVFEPAGSVDPMVLMRNFLGKDPGY